MGTTKRTVWGMLVLVAMAAGLLLTRAHYLDEQRHCQQRLQRVARMLDAAQRGGTLPTSLPALSALIGPLPTSTIGQSPYRIVAQTPLTWRSGPAQPYLVDPGPHPFVNGIHVLYTDGSVRTVAVMPHITPDAAPAR